MSQAEHDSRLTGVAADALLAALVEARKKALPSAALEAAFPEVYGTGDPAKIKDLEGEYETILREVHATLLYALVKGTALML